VDISSHVTRVDPGGRPGRVHAIPARAAAVWRIPEQRQVAFALLAALGGAVVFARITEDYLTNDPLVRWDVSFARWLSEHRGSALLDVFRAITVVGSPAFALALATVVCLVLYRRRRLVDAAFLPVVLGGAELLNLVLKVAFHRPRPAIGFVHLDTYSFPSGHAMISTAMYGAFAFLLWGRLDSRHAKTLVLAATSLVVTLICFSRLYLGVHFLSDVLAGVAGGATWLALSIALLTASGERFVARFTGSGVDRLGRRLTRS
jgi:membrane-associated phospholipid phosphatase